MNKKILTEHRRRRGLPIHLPADGFQWCPDFSSMAKLGAGVVTDGAIAATGHRSVHRLHAKLRKNGEGYRKREVQNDG